MLRVAHISDLHIRHPQMNNDDLSLLQRAAAALGEMAGIKVEAGGHSDLKLTALQNILGLLKPDLIVVTGDITNFGDRKSFEMAYAFLMKLKEVSGAKDVLCVPGNHDCLCERAAEVQLDRKRGLLLRALSLVNREIDVMSQPKPGSLNPSFQTLLDAADGLTLFTNYEDSIVKNGLGTVDPSSPVFVDAGWGMVALFLFNSVNDPGLMANKGRIGPAQFNLLNQCLQSQEKAAQCANAVRIALLHHHPISAPQSLDKDVNRFYDWMTDGPRLLQYLNGRQFHFILHGHQHEPFQCTVNYLETPGAGLHIVAAGSASQGSTPPHHNSFNLIDLFTPFEARVRRFDYEETGFDEKRPSLDTMMSVRPIEEIRVSSGPVTNVEDWAMRELIRGCYEDAYDIDAQHQYSLLDYKISVTSAQVYQAAYRRKGVVVGDDVSDGPHFVVTGSPAMKTDKMKLSATNNVDSSQLDVKVLMDQPNQKVIRVLTRTQMRPGSDFDITLSFEWRATESEPNDFDGINLMSFRHPVEHLSYSATLPWQPAQAKVLGYGIQNVTPKLQKESLKPAAASGTFSYSFEIERPAPMAYLISFRPNG